LDEELPRVAGVRRDRPSEWSVAQHAEVEMGSLARDVRDATRARDRDGQRQEGDAPEDRGGSTPAQRLKKQTGGEERERAAEIERGDIEADRAATTRGLRVLSDEAHAGHVDAGEAESRRHPKR